MIKKGSIVKYLGNDIASHSARRYMVGDWRPDYFTTGALGICESCGGSSVQGYKLYKCRFLDERIPIQYKTENFFFFEVEEV